MVKFPQPLEREAVVMNLIQMLKILFENCYS